MKEDRFDELMRDAALTYHQPPDAPLDEMWEEIEGSLETSIGGARLGAMRSRPRLWQRQWFRVAAALVIGVGLGRVWTTQSRSSAFSGTSVVDGSSSRADSAGRPSLNEPYDRATTRYLGQTAALLIALPNEVRAGRADSQFVSRAGDLLLTTRLLLDSPASHDPAMRNLLEDLELVLAQVVRLKSERGRAELDLINQALEQRDVMPRLQSAVADISADD